MEIREKLESIYLEFNKKKFIDPDPLLFLYDYPEVRDREIAGYIAASLAFGRVSQIIKKVSQVLAIIGKSPFKYVANSKKQTIIQDFKPFRYRFVSGRNLAHLVLAIKEVILEYSSLENCFLLAWTKDDETILPGLFYLTQQILQQDNVGYLVADPAKKSACKRSNLFLRWMVRKDEVDPGGWNSIPTSQLIIPLDAHMYRTGKMLGFTKRKNPDMKTAIEITSGFRKILRNDPVKYDFALTRFGIRNELNIENLEKVICHEN